MTAYDYYLQEKRDFEVKVSSQTAFFKTIKPIEYDSDGKLSLEHEHMRRSIVQFLFEKDGDDFIPIGTGFVLSYDFVMPESDSGPISTWISTFLVTCKHIIQDSEDENSDLYVRFSSSERGKEPKSDYFKLDNNWIPHPDDKIDMAICELTPMWMMEVNENNELDGFVLGAVSYFSKSDYEEHHWKASVRFPTTPNITPQQQWEKFFISDEQFQRIPIGQDIQYTGLFYPYFGDVANEPIVRFGKVCLVPKGDLILQGFRYNLLIQSEVYSGHSGSPVFAKMSVKNDMGKSVDRSVIIGLVSGTYLNPVERVEVLVKDDNDGKWNTDENTIVKGRYNSEIGFITDINHLKGLLESEGFRNSMKRSRELTLKTLAKRQKEHYKKNQTALRSKPVKKDETQVESFTEKDFKTALRKVSKTKKDKN